jgi:hypothetical protein
MKNLISIGLSLLIALNTFGFNLIVIFLIQESRSENLEIIGEHPETVAAKNIITFSLKHDKPEIIKSKEIRFNHEMYDVVYKMDEEGDTILYCVNDKKESQLHAAFRSINELNGNPASVPDHIAFTIFKNLLKNYLPLPQSNLIQNFNARCFCITDLLSIPSVIPEKVYPPPQFHIISC